MEFKKGDSVAWYSQSHGSGKLKKGIVVAIVPAETAPVHVTLPAGMKLPRSLTPGGYRNHVSYLIQVGKQTRLYWPLVKNLEPI